MSGGTVVEQNDVNKSRIVAFYKGENVHPLKYTIQEMWTWEGRQIEGTHSFIQWIFPLNEASANSFKAPILNDQEIEEFKTNAKVRENMMMSLRMMLKYYGFAFAPDGESIQKAIDFEARSGWLYPSNHNYLRVTRILKSLMLLDFQKEARAFFAALRNVYQTHHRYIGPITWKFWCEAVGERQ
jgi:hypothetical protein